jgi:putative endonuclease
MNTTTLNGAEAEERACGLLKAEGYEIVARNWRSPFGEIDIVAREGPILAFVEVKARSGEAFGGPEGAVHLVKQRRVAAAASAFLAETDCQLPARFDVVAFVGGAVRLYRDAFRVE